MNTNTEEKIKRGEKLKELREKKKKIDKIYTQQYMADELGIDIKNYERWEGRGQGLDDINNLKRLCSILNEPLQVFIGEDEPDVDDSNSFIEQYRRKTEDFDIIALAELLEITSKAINDLIHCGK